MLKCKFCPETFSSITGLRVHVEEEHKVEFTKIKKALEDVDRYLRQLVEHET